MNAQRECLKLGNPSRSWVILRESVGGGQGGGARVDVSQAGRRWPLDRYAETVAHTTTREAMTQGTVNRLREHGIVLAQVSAHNAKDFCIYYENAVVSIGDEPHPVYPPISSVNGGPPFHPNCVHVLTPFVERLATEEEKRGGWCRRRC